MTSFSENVKYVNKNCNYDPSNDLGELTHERVSLFMDHPVDMTV